MSDDYLRLIPVNPEYVPDALAREDARRLLIALVPGADEVLAKITDDVKFVDQGRNFERIVCPSCGSELDVRWWQEAMDSAYATKFTDLVVSLPCCHNECSLNDLHYEWSAGFARFVLEALNPNADLDETQIHALEAKLGSALRKIWARY